MYLIEYVNLVREAQGYDPIDRLPLAADPGVSPLEIAMGCRLEPGVMRLSSPDAARRVAAATRQPVGFDGSSVVLPPALDGHTVALARARAGDGAVAAQAI